MTKDSLLISVFTPAYNRAHLLSDLYKSLLKQDFKNFEWIIVDDGSTDDTENIVSGFILEKKINIKYVYQENAGKHIAINTGVKNASGKYFFIVDSDDYVTSNSLNSIIKWFKTIDNETCFAGIGGLKVFKNSDNIGKTFIGNYIDCTSLERRKYNILGDKAEVFYTDILKKYPFPKIDDEKFVAEAYIWNKIANDGYKIRWVNEPFIVCEYLEDGLTKNSSKLIENNWKGQLLYLKDLIKFDDRFFGKIAHYASFCGLAKKHYGFKYIKKELNIGIIPVLLFMVIYKVRKWL